MEVAVAIVRTRCDRSDRPLKDQKMKAVTVDTFGVDYPEPEIFTFWVEANKE